MFPRLLTVFFSFISLAAAGLAAEPPADALPPGLYAEITTPRGTLTCELFFTQAPLTVANFVGLAEGKLGPSPRKPFFDGLKFHRVVPDFVVQGGDPLGTGEGGPGYAFPDEFVAGLRHDAAGVLSMANSGPDTNGSQFFITLREANRLNYLHSVFGRAIRGLDILPQLRPGDTMSVRVLRIGSAAEAFRADAFNFAELVANAKIPPASFPPENTPLETFGKTKESTLTFFDDSDQLLSSEPPRARAFNSKLANFQRVNGVKLHARLFAHTPAGAEGRKLNSFVRDLAGKLGVLKQGAVVLYFADHAEWKLWLGDDSAPAFMGRAGTVKEFTQNGAFHQAKQDFFAGARTQAEAAIERAAQAQPGQPLTPAQTLKHHVDAVLDRLIFRLESK